MHVTSIPMLSTTMGVSASHLQVHMLKLKLVPRPVLLWVILTPKDLGKGLPIFTTAAHVCTGYWTGSFLQAPLRNPSIAVLGIIRFFPERI